MTQNVTNYRCPSCEGPLHFDGESGQVECDYCSSKFDIVEIEKLYAEKDSAAAAAEEPQWDTSMAGSEWSED
jgi:DNA-directed RNA polymerase subunit RPC12/RpoP